MGGNEVVHQISTDRTNDVVHCIDGGSAVSDTVSQIISGNTEMI